MPPMMNSVLIQSVNGPGMARDSPMMMRAILTHPYNSKSPATVNNKPTPRAVHHGVPHNMTMIVAE